MKEIHCQNCGEIINSGYAINPQNSALCEDCYEKEWSKITPEDL